MPVTSHLNSNGSFLMWPGEISSLFYRLNIPDYAVVVLTAFYLLVSLQLSTSTVHEKAVKRL
jgi:hypothetical protein